MVKTYKQKTNRGDWSKESMKNAGRLKGKWVQSNTWQNASIAVKKIDNVTSLTRHSRNYLQKLSKQEISMSSIKKVANFNFITSILKCSFRNIICLSFPFEINKK